MAQPENAAGPWDDMCLEKSDFEVALGEARCSFLRQTQAGWGACFVCSLKAKRNRFGHGSEHFETCGHKDAVAWATRKVADGVTAPVCHTVEAPSVNVAMPSTMGEQECLGEQTLKPVRDVWVETFLPESCPAGATIDGAFLVDSFFI